jgi:DNA (cytosine-5)-methyltransferase 3A
MNVLSLFDGISCGRIALERAGLYIENYFACEIDKWAIQVSKMNYPDIIHLGDVYQIDYSQLPKIDLVIGGSPCTHWSIAKKNRETTNEGIGFDLFMQYVRAVKETGCKWFLYENNFSIHVNIKKEISKALKVPFWLINSSIFSAQNRKRCYWTNIRIDFIPSDKKKLLSDILENDVDKKYYLSEKMLKSFLSDKNRNGFIRSERFKPIGNFTKKSFCVTTRSGQRATDNFIIQRPRGYNKGGVKNSGKTPTITSSSWDQNNVLYQDQRIRKLTPLECERLQTLPDNYTSSLSDVQRYKCISNGWTVDVIAHILQFIPIQNKNEEKKAG